MEFVAKQGHYQQGICFVASETADLSMKTCELNYGHSSILADIRLSDKVPKGVIILDTRIFEMLCCKDEDTINLVRKTEKIPTCTEIHLDVISKRSIKSHDVAQAISKRIDDFQEHFDGLILHRGQEFSVSILGISLIVRSLSPRSVESESARIVWKQLLKIHLGAVDSTPNNLCILAEVSAATQIRDVVASTGHDDENITRHQAILFALESIEKNLHCHSVDVQFVGLAFSDEVIPFVTYDPQTGDASDITPLHSSSLIGAFRNWLDALPDEHESRSSNPGVSLLHASEKAKSLTKMNGLPTTIIFFSSGVYSSGRNPVKVTRTNLGDPSLKILSISVGENSATDIMEEIAREGNGTMIHLNRVDRADLIMNNVNALMAGVR